MPDQMRSYLDFEKPVAEIEAKMEELRALAASGSDIGDEVAQIEVKAAQALGEIYANDAVAEDAGGAPPPAAPSASTTSLR